MQNLPHLRLLLGNVYRQFHELPDRSPGHGLRRQRDDSSRLFRPYRVGQARRDGGDGPGTEEHPPPGHHDRKCSSECADGGYGSGVLHQQYAAPSGHCPRMRRESESGACQRDQRQDPQSLPSGSCGPNLYGGSERGRRRLRRDEGANQKGAVAHRLHDRYRKNHRRKHRKQRQSKPGGHPSGGKSLQRNRWHCHSEGKSGPRRQCGQALCRTSRNAGA